MTECHSKSNLCEQKRQSIDLAIQDVLSHFTYVNFAILFGSLARGGHHAESDLDIGVAATHLLSVEERIAIISALAERTGRPVDLVDLKVVHEPLLGQVIRYGRRILGSDTYYAELILRHLYEQADFMPYRNRILTERRQKWIGKS